MNAWMGAYPDLIASKYKQVPSSLFYPSPSFTFDSPPFSSTPSPFLSLRRPFLLIQLSDLATIHSLNLGDKPTRLPRATTRQSSISSHKTENGSTRKEALHHPKFGELLRHLVQTFRCVSLDTLFSFSSSNFSQISREPFAHSFRPLRVPIAFLFLLPPITPNKALGPSKIAKSATVLENYDFEQVSTRELFYFGKNLLKRALTLS